MLVNFVLMGLIESALAHVMAWYLILTGTKPLPKPMMNQLTEAYLGHQAWVS